MRKGNKSFLCGCGQRHLKTDDIQIIKLHGCKWNLFCYLSIIQEEIKNIKLETMLSQLVLTHIKTKHPEIDIEAYAKEVAQNLNKEYENSLKGEKTND